MPIVSIRIPQLGEGLQEALLVKKLKQPGDWIRLDDPIYEIETDKATSEIESAYEGKLVDWCVDEDMTLAIGAEVARIEVADGAATAASESSHEPAAAKPADPVGRIAARRREADREGPLRNRDLPPRTRRALRRHGLLSLADQIPAQGKHLLPSDVEAYLALPESERLSARSAGKGTSPAFDEVKLPSAQQKLNHRMLQGLQRCVPASALIEVDWTAIAAAQEADSGKGRPPSAFTRMLWCVTQAMARHPKFRSSLSSDGTQVRTYRHVNLGVAVALPDDRLLTAVVSRADTLDWKTFCDSVRRQIDRAREGHDQIDGATTLTVSNIGSLGMRSGVPVVVPPAVGTLVLGETYWHPVSGPDGFVFRRVANVCLSFDHRIVNGASGAAFLNDLKSAIETFQQP